MYIPSQIAEEYAFLKNENPEAVLQRFFGIFFLCFHSAQVWGNMISSFVLSGPSGTVDMNLDDNVTMHFEQCGANFCPPIPESLSMFNGTASESTGSGMSYKPEAGKIDILTGIFVGCSVAAALVIYFLVDNLKRYLHILSIVVIVIKSSVHEM